MMIYVVATLSALATGGLLALLFRVTTGIEHQGILFAIGILGGAIQWLLLIGWYLYHTRIKQAPPERVEPGI
jgi:hypothetical protein